MISSISRVRRDTRPSSKASFTLGAFASAVFDGGGNLIRWNPPGPAVTSVASPSFLSGKITKDEVHKGPIRERMGGPFLSLLYSLGYDPSGVIGSGTYYNRDPTTGKKVQRYVGGFMPPPNSYFGSGFDFGPNLASSLIETNVVIPSMTGLGNRAWKASKPKLEQMSLFQDVFESGEIPGQWSGTRDFVSRMRETAAEYKDSYLRHVSRTPGGLNTGNRLLNVVSQEWLNANFGWLPFLRSVYDLSQIIGNFSNFVKKFTKLNGTSFRRRVSLVNDEPTTNVLSKVQLAVNSTSYAIPCFPQSFPSSYFSSPPHYELSEETRLRQWGVGKWTFYRPEFDEHDPNYYSEWNKVRQALTLSGLRITPSSLYNVIPWTWLLSWVTNVGDYVDELTDIWFDQIVNHYCFAMQAKEVSRRLTISLPLHDGLLNLTWSRVIASKQRSKASSPFGFDLDVSNLSLRQLSILGAIKSSRRR